MAVHVTCPPHRSAANSSPSPLVLPSRPDRFTQGQRVLATLATHSFSPVTEQLKISSESLEYFLTGLENIPRTQDPARIGCPRVLRIKCHVALALELQPVLIAKHQIEKALTMNSAEQVTTGAQHAAQLIKPCPLPL